MGSQRWYCLPGHRHSGWSQIRVFCVNKTKRRKHAQIFDGACDILRREHMEETLLFFWSSSFPFCIQRKVTLGVTCAKWQELGHTFTMASPFSCYSSTPVILFSLERGQSSGQIDSLLFLHPSLRTPVCWLCLQICPISSGNQEELSRHQAFHFSVGDVTNAVTVMWKSTHSELLLLLLKPSSSSAAIFIVMDNDSNFVGGL